MSRNAIYNALFALGQTATVGGQPAFSETGRRLKAPDQSQMPALFQVEPQEDMITVDGRLKRREFSVMWFIYHNAGTDQSVAPAATSADLLDAIEAALQPMLPGGYQTLGGLVYAAFIDGQVKRWDGDLDGISIMMIPIKVIAP